MLRRLIPFVVGTALVAGLTAPTAAQAQAPSATSQVAAIEARYPGIQFATPADAIEYGPALDAMNPQSVPPPDPSEEYTVAQYKAVLMGRRYGPSPNTYGGEFTITGWTASGNRWLRTRSAVSCPACEMVGADVSAPDGLGLPNWANPIKWNWHNMLGAAMDTIWNGCVKGALTGVVSTATATIAANLAARAAPIYLGPYGYAAFAIGSCVVGIINR